jgi:hypothetical protein
MCKGIQSKIAPSSPAADLPDGSTPGSAVAIDSFVYSSDQSKPESGAAF